MGYPVIRKIDKSNWTQENIAWVAGLLEAEGNFAWKENKKRGKITIQSIRRKEKAKEILDLLEYHD